jgi:hypothetical protein
MLEAPSKHASETWSALVKEIKKHLVSREYGNNIEFGDLAQTLYSVLAIMAQRPYDGVSMTYMSELKLATA